MMYSLQIGKFISQFCRRSLRFHNFSTIRNVAVVAHVDHGKTTLIDEFLKCSGENISNSRMMDSMDLERERGITITSKVTRINWKDSILNIVDTPGHADFGGEVERIMNIVDCVCLLVDVVEGPKPQTNYVLRKALENPLMRAVVVVNKCDRECNKSQSDIENELLDLFIDCNASDDQLDYPILYASAKESRVSLSYPMSNDLSIDYILEILLEKSPKPKIIDTDDFIFQITLLDIDEGQLLLTGKIYSGNIKLYKNLYIIDPNGNKKGNIIIRDIYITKQINKIKLLNIPLPGDIITILCNNKGNIPNINDTITNNINIKPLLPIKLDEPVIYVKITSNNSPLSCIDSKYNKISDIGKRLKKEILINLTLQLEESNDKTYYILKGRGELQIGILLENMRREGYEMTISSPEAITFNDNGIIKEAFQKLIAFIPTEFSPNTIELLANRNIQLISYSDSEGGSGQYRTLEFHGSASQMIGIMTSLRDITRGRGEFSVNTIDYCKYDGTRYNNRNSGCLISSCSGISTAFGLEPALSRGTLFIPEGTRVYEGMIIGESNTNENLYLNVTKVKPVTGMRNKGHEQVIKISNRNFNVEQALTFINHDEQLELTPKRITLRKKILTRHN